MNQSLVSRSHPKVPVRQRFQRLVHGVSCRCRWTVLWVGVLLVAGCTRREQENQPDVQAVTNPLGRVQLLVRQGRWDDAWRLSDEVLQRNAEDPKALTVLAEVAYRRGEQATAADLLVRSCEADAFESPNRVQQAMVALIANGELFRCISFLNEAVQKDPDASELRRTLYDFLIGTENRLDAKPHLQALVRSRRFDIDLLLSWGTSQTRSLENAPLDEMLKRQPSDPRPKIGAARRELDQGNLVECRRLAQEILEAEPNMVSAQVLLAQACARGNTWDDLKEVVSRFSDSVAEHPDYWVAMGQWAESRDATQAAARAYWEATRCDPLHTDAWLKLVGMVDQVEASRLNVSPSTLDSMKQHANLLSSLAQQLNRFERSGRISRAIAMQLVDSYESLGQLWLAEAWAAIATTLPEDDTVKVLAKRKQIVDKLAGNTPWLSSNDKPWGQVTLAHLPRPTIAIQPRVSRETPSRVTRSESPNEPEAEASIMGRGTVSRNFRLVDEAARRGIVFHGKTGEQLDQPGISLHETLGCGGGSLDFDRDGWTDLILMAAGGTPGQADSEVNGLYRNLGGEFTDIGRLASVTDRRFGQGVAVGDLNADGLADFITLNYGTNRVFINQGDGSFQDQTSLWTPNQPVVWSTSAAIADVTGNGIADVLVLNYCAGLSPATRTCPSEDPNVVRSCTPVLFDAASDQFWEGGLTGEFINRTDARLRQPSDLGRGLGIVVGQLDDQGGLDAFVANDMTANHYWSFPRDEPGAEGAPLIDSALPRGLAVNAQSMTQGSMGIAASDLDRDGDLDFFVTNFDREYNTLHTQVVSGTWRDTTRAAGLAEPSLPWVGFGSEAVDFDGDGWDEVIVTNGHVDVFSRDDQPAQYGQLAQLFFRNDEGVYQTLAFDDQEVYLRQKHVGRGLWTIDADNDRRVDIVITHQTEPVSLLMNQAIELEQSTTLAIDLVGTRSGRDAVGARVTAIYGGQRQTRFLVSGDGYLCSNTKRLHFGLGGHQGAVDIEVTWPDRKTQSFRLAEPNASYVLVEGTEESFRLSDTP
ncbi:MAG: FG-GAP-like repeat-containing protein [Planctomycetota bacterium]